MLSQDGIQITEEAVKAAAGNWWCGKEVMKLLLSRDGEIQITEDILKAAAWNCSEEAMQLLLSRGEIHITEDVLMAATRNR